MGTVNAHSRIKDLGLELPPAPSPVASYIPTRMVRLDATRSLLYTSGVLPMVDGQLGYQGAVGSDVDIPTAQQAARVCALNLLSLLEATCGLDHLIQVVQITGFVCSASGFNQQPQVLNGASELLAEVLGEAGRHTRMALGANELPLGACVEVSAVFEIGTPA